MPITARSYSEARRLGLGRYFTGQPCKRGHVSERYASGATCVACMGYGSRQNWKRTNADTAKCRKCGEQKEAASFRVVKRSNGARYRSSYCRECHTEMTADWRRRNDDKYRSGLRRQQRRVITDPVAKEASRRAHRKWAASNREKVRTAVKRRRGRRLGADGWHSSEEWARRVAEFNCHCAYCLSPMDRPTQDHMRPLSRGGTNDIDNLIPACVSCNSRKNARTLLEFAAGMPVPMSLQC